MADADYIIVGSGINALVCTGLLSRAGYSVLMLERNDRLGGAIRTDELTLPGFRHDVMSSWHPLFVTSPGYAALGPDLHQHGLDYAFAEIPTASALPDGRALVLHADHGKNIDGFERAHPGEGARHAAFMAEFGPTIDLTFGLLGAQLWSWPIAKTLVKTAWKQGPQDLAGFFGYAMEPARAWLERQYQSDLVHALLAPWTLHVGLGPDDTLSGHMARVVTVAIEMAGIPVVKGGSDHFVNAFARLLDDQRVEMKTGVHVARVLVENGRGVGVSTAAGERIGARRGVICSVTPTQLYFDLLRDAPVPDAIKAQAQNFRYGRADMQIHLALSAPLDWPSADLQKVAMVHLASGVDSVSKAVNEATRGLLPAEPSVVVGQPTAVDPSRCPAGSSILWLQLQEMPARIKGDALGEIPAPADGAWTTDIAERVADRVIDQIERHAPGTKSKIQARKVISPRDLTQLNINLVGGDPYGGICSIDQFGLWRPLRGVKNHGTPFKNVFHIGASTHPGPGLSGNSGYLLAKSLGA